MNTFIWWCPKCKKEQPQDWTYCTCETRLERGLFIAVERSAYDAMQARLTDAERLAGLVGALFRYVEIFDGPIKREVERLARPLAPDAPLQDETGTGEMTMPIFDEPDPRLTVDATPAEVDRIVQALRKGPSDVPTSGVFQDISTDHVHVKFERVEPKDGE